MSTTVEYAQNAEGGEDPEDVEPGGTAWKVVEGCVGRWNTSENARDADGREGGGRPWKGAEGRGGPRKAVEGRGRPRKAAEDAEDAEDAEGDRGRRRVTEPGGIRWSIVEAFEEVEGDEDAEGNGYC
eukprot:gene15767-biopygen6703